ncbi:Plasmodium variant antigen protein Cir/Yir/Bir, putative [Plasmodium chabaudi adami]|uniref:Plasmodium variant antigen protein Cir/Yir/Bir, putative n=1 Tax=Plasmodium chabaudi adami TaxID=5826 RepID=A0A1D3L938_PLACE|nr:Plasmodium variant antigen protein Cir/Yir/Bir, putative [Plasmodium chabaudi adami]
MENSSYDIENVCEEIKKIDDCLQIDIISTGVCSDDTLYSDYCPMKNGKKGQCETNNDKISAGFIWLLVTFESLCEDECSQNEKDQYAEYAILWLSYILNQMPNEGIHTLKNFYTNNIEKNTKYTNHVASASDNNYKEIVDKKIDLMNMNKNIISKFYNVFKSLCNMYSELDENDSNYPKCLQSAQKFVGEYQKFLNNNDVDTDDSSYKKILPILSNGYDNFKKKCNNGKYSDFPPFPMTKTTQHSAHISEATSSSSSTASKLIPVLSIFVAIPILLGIAYKYSLFGIDKRLKIQYLREKLKKLKKKMNNYV